jgi:hypothetical protein
MQPGSQRQASLVPAQGLPLLLLALPPTLLLLLLLLWLQLLLMVPRAPCQPGLSMIENSLAQMTCALTDARQTRYLRFAHQSWLLRLLVLLLLLLPAGCLLQLQTG